MCIVYVSYHTLQWHHISLTIWTLLWLFSHESKVCNLNYHLNCAIWIIIWIVQFELSFERRYFGPCVCQITSRCVIWNAHFKWRSGGVFQLCISQITQQNCCMNALTSKLWFGGGATWPSNHFHLYTARCICTEAQEMRALCMFDWQGTQTFFSRSGMLNPKRAQIRSLVCTLLNSNITIKSLVCTLHNLNCAIRMIIQIAHFAFAWKQSMMPWIVIDLAFCYDDTLFWKQHNLEVQASNPMAWNLQSIYDSKVNFSKKYGSNK